MRKKFLLLFFYALITVCLLPLLITAGCRTFFESEEPLPTIEGAFLHRNGFHAFPVMMTSMFITNKPFTQDSTGLRYRGLLKAVKPVMAPAAFTSRQKAALITSSTFSRLSAAQSSEICLECHRGAPVMNWRANSHLLNDVGCNECHKSHKVSGAKMVYLGDPDICFTCHHEKRAQQMLPSHHP